MTNYVKPADFINDQLPLKFRSLVPTTLKQAYRAAEELAKDQPILEVQSARANRGRLRSWATDLAFQRLMETGQWPFDYDWDWFERPTGRYLRIRLESSVMSISLVADPSQPPRTVRFRANNALGNPALCLWPDMQDEQKIVGLPSFLLVHGHGKEPSFAHIGVPDPKKRVWLDKTPNLMTMPHAINVAEDLPAVEPTDEAIVTLKDQLRQWQHDHDNPL